jgi:hypothetical protein
VTILTVDPVRMTASVLSSDGQVLPDVLIISEAGPDGGGDISTPEPGWKGKLTHELGMEAIEHCFPPASYFAEGRPPEHDDYDKALNTWLSLTGSPTPYRVVEHKVKNFRSHRPYDLIAGDRGFRSSDGASVFALRGGVAGIKVDDLCQLLMMQVDHLTRLVSRQFQMFTDWGHIEILNDEGKTKLHMRCNMHGPNTYDDKFAFDLVLGKSDSEGSPFLSWTLHAKDCETPVATFQLDQNGVQHRWLKGDELTEINGNQGVGITKNQKLIVGGSQEIDVDGSSVETIGVKKTINSPHVHLGGEGGQPAVMGTDAVNLLKKLIQYINTELVLVSPMGPTFPPGAAAAGHPFVDGLDILSHVVDLTKN